MFKYTKDNVTVLTVHDTRRAKASGLFPVKVQVIYQRKQRYYKTGKELTTEDWDRLLTGKSRELKDIRDSIENSYSIVRANVEALAERGDFSFDMLNVRLGRGTSDTLNCAFEAKTEQLKREDRINSMSYYSNVLKNLELYAGTRIGFEIVTADWLRSFEKHLLKTKGHTTVGMFMRAIRSIMNDARKMGVIRDVQYPFGKGKYEIKATEAHKRALTLQQVGQIVRFTDGTQTTERYRDLWFFIYLCNGMNVADVVKLKYSNIRDGEICFIRQKTERTTKTLKEIRVAVTPEVEAIISRWGNEYRADNYIFPCLTDSMDAEQRNKYTKELTKRINKRMKIIGAALGIGNITTYTARHSFATVLKRSGANIAFISESLGHSDLKTTESYLASFEKGERQKNAVLLTNFDEDDQ